MGKSVNCFILLDMPFELKHLNDCVMLPSVTLFLAHLFKRKHNQYLKLSISSIHLFRS